MVKKLLLAGLAVFLVALSSSTGGAEDKMRFTGARGEVQLITLDPGHFHAALVQKTMHDQVSPKVYVYAPKGPDVEDYLKQIEGFNNRLENPTDWEQIVYTGDDFLEKMLREKPGNVVVISGNNKRKAEYIKACADAGLNVLADKPMCIDVNGFKLLKEAFASAEKNGVMIYDIMTERSEITTVLQKELVQNKDVFGELQKGTVDEPAVVKESVHHFFKYVTGNPIKRPAWYFDTTQQGQGLVDVTTHLVDLVMWGCFPGEAIDYQKDTEIKKAKRWPTIITPAQFKSVTRLDDFPIFLKEKLNDEGALPCYANGEINYTLKGINTKVSVKWNFQAPEGTGDTHYSVIKGSKANIIIRQQKEENYRPELYIEAAINTNRDNLDDALKKAIAELQSKYPGVELEQKSDIWHVLIPDKYRIGHEAHFGQVMERYLKYLVEGKLPDWEVPNIKAKYYTTTKALESANTAGCSARPKVEFIQGDNKIDVMIGGKYFTSYLYGDKLTKPVLFPVCTPSGIMVNRSYPLIKVEGESEDHPHHVGVFFAYDRVNNDGFWNNTTSPPQIKHIKVTDMTGGDDKGELSTTLHWVGKSGQILLVEKRDMVFQADNNEYIIDFSINLTAQDTKVVFNDTKEGMFAIRVADWLREAGGSGNYFNSSAEETEKNIWGKRARWVCLQGKKDGRIIGIAVFNHPASVNYPTYWHVRGYGLFSANSLGQYVFERSRQQENAQPFQLTLGPGETAHFRFCMVIYEGAKTMEQLESRFEKFVE